MHALVRYLAGKSIISSLLGISHAAVLWWGYRERLSEDTWCAQHALLRWGAIT